MNNGRHAELKLWAKNEIIQAKKFVTVKNFSS